MGSGYFVAAIVVSALALPNGLSRRFDVACLLVVVYGRECLPSIPPPPYTHTHSFLRPFVLYLFYIYVHRKNLCSSISTSDDSLL